MKIWTIVLEAFNKSDNHKKLLFEVFQQRKDNERISSDPQLVFDDHFKFVEDHPYFIGFWLKQRIVILGSKYQHENSFRHTFIR